MSILVFLRVKLTVMVFGNLLRAIMRVRIRSTIQGLVVQVRTNVRVAGVPTGVILIIVPIRRTIFVRGGMPIIVGIRIAVIG